MPETLIAPAVPPVPAAPDAATPIIVAAFYKFVALPDYAARRALLQTHCLRHGLLGTILLASEGINGTVCGTREAVQALCDYFARDAAFAGITPKFSFAPEAAFHRMKVRLKTEIVSMGQPQLDPKNVGHYVPPNEWNALIARDDTLVIDTRNRYEVAIGSFEGAINPETNSFREFPSWVDDYLRALPANAKPKNIALFCTGGIRCEKATAYLRAQGHNNVHHLQGGILKYLEHVPPAASTWQGDCFVFDQRVSVKSSDDKALHQGDYDMCHACRMPISAADKAEPVYEAGVQCPHCADAVSETDRQRFRERQKQIKLSRARGEKHLGQTQQIK